MADILSIGANAAQLYKSALATVGNNIANLNTEGYTRQVANSVENAPTPTGLRCKQNSCQPPATIK